MASSWLRGTTCVIDDRAHKGDAVLTVRCWFKELYMHRRLPLAHLAAAAVLLSAANLAHSATTLASASPAVAVGPQ